MVVAYTTSAEQRAVETVTRMDIPHSGIMLEHTSLFTFCSTALVGATLGRCLNSAVNSILRAGIVSAGSNCPICFPWK